VVRRVLRFLIVLGIALGMVVGAAQLGRLYGVAAGGGVFAIGLTILWLPRAANKAFKAGNFGRARGLYLVLRVVIFDRWTRASVDVSLAACALARFSYRDALALLEQVDLDALSEAARAVWLNNRAYARARLGEDKEAALDDITEAIEMRPQVAGFRHTRGLALLALGRLDEAIRELDAVWRRQSGDEETPFLEAERCYDIGVAWTQRGELEYAADYFDRARRAAPDSPWAKRALTELETKQPRAYPVPALSELI